MTTRAACHCGQVTIAFEGLPIMSAECCCTSCQTAGARFERLEGAGPVLTPYGATPYTMVRKDRVRLESGAGQLEALRLKPGASTRRVVATCCNTPMFLEFVAGHWMSIYSERIAPGARQPIRLRTMTGDLPDPSVLPDDVPNPRKHTVGFMARLLGAWVAMGFRSPKIDWTEEATG